MECEKNGERNEACGVEYGGVSNSRPQITHPSDGDNDWVDHPCSRELILKNKGVLGQEKEIYTCTFFSASA
jgi:hypothetical protein